MTIVTNNICSSCGSECLENTKFCRECGAELINKSIAEFGNGKPLVLFKLLYNPYLVISVFMIFISMINMYSDVKNYYNTDFILYIEYYSNIYLVFLMILDVTFILLLLNTRFKNNRIGFSKLQIYRMLILVISPFIGMLIAYFEFGIDSINIQAMVGPLVIQLIMSVLIYSYLIQLFDFKWFDFSNIL
jgi:hypothetical protein